MRIEGWWMDGWMDGGDVKNNILGGRVENDTIGQDRTGRENRPREEKLTRIREIDSSQGTQKGRGRSTKTDCRGGCSQW